MSPDKYRIDSHKLMYHPDRVSAWLEGEKVYPLYMEISPSGACNHRCTYCALDFMEYQRRFLDKAVLKERLSELGRLGLKSVMYAGEGEPLLHEDLAEIVSHTKASGIDAAMSTNAVLFDGAAAEEILGATKWIKVSINGATEQTYAQIHRCKNGDFGRVIKNVSRAVELRQSGGYECALGMQLLLLPENEHEATALAKLARDIGIDYLVIKPYSQHPQSKTERYRDITYRDYEDLADELAEFNDENFSVIFRARTMEKWDRADRSYQRCLALPFWSYIDAGGCVWGCSMYLGDERFYYGDIYQDSFEQIWQGPRRAESLAWVENELDVCRCRVNCRMDEINGYLGELKHPLEHVNFI